MRQQLLAFLVSFSVFFSTMLLADELKLKADAPSLYLVKSGDTYGILLVCIYNIPGYGRVYGS